MNGTFANCQQSLDADLDALLQLARITRDAADELADEGKPPQ
jgi:hypothetical protein